jgi:hypothetical protein
MGCRASLFPGSRRGTALMASISAPACLPPESLRAVAIMGTRPREAEAQEVDDRQGRPACPHATIELEQTLSMEWHKAVGIWREFATSFPVPLGARNACNWAIHGCICASAEAAVMSVAVISRPTATRRGIFIKPITQSSKPMIRPKARAGATLTKSCLTCRIGLRRKEVRSRDFIDAIPRCRKGL